MGRKCKCAICKATLNTDTAYKVVRSSLKTGKLRNTYYCNEEEYKSIEAEKLFLKKCQLKVDEILGYTCVNNAKNKELAELTKSGYTRQQIYKVMKECEDIIVKGLDSKRKTMNEYQQIRYIYTIVGNRLRDYYGGIKKEIKLDKNEYDFEESNIEFIEEITVVNKKKRKKEGLLDIL